MNSKDHGNPNSIIQANEIQKFSVDEKSRVERISRWLLDPSGVGLFIREITVVLKYLHDFTWLFDLTPSSVLVSVNLRQGLTVERFSYHKYHFLQTK